MFRNHIIHFYNSILPNLFGKQLSIKNIFLVKSPNWDRLYIFFARSVNGKTSFVFMVCKRDKKHDAKLVFGAYHSGGIRTFAGKN